MNTIFRISVITIKELLHEKILYLLGAFALLALALSVFLGDLTYAEQSKITLDFLLAGIEITNLLFSIFMGITLLHRELNLGWIAMVLSKPVSRPHFLLGKFLGQISIQGLVLFLLGLLTLALCHFNHIAIAHKAIFQSLFLMFLEGIVITSIVYFFAVNLGALIAAAASISVFALGNFMDATVKTNAVVEQSGGMRMLKAIIPNFRIFNMKTLVSYGLSIDWNSVAIVAAYSAVCTAMYLVLASLCFSRRDIFT